ncbi:hypothetical protein HYW61_01880 [candidate division WWE3 bacterium]|nr:hypothetical protein [candidate division WWE3 bacterium]
MSEPILAISLLVVTFAVIVIFMLSTLLLQNLYFRLKRLRKSHVVKVEENAYENAERIMGDARIEALAIIEASNKKAQKVLEDAAQFSSSSQNLLDAKLQEVAQKQSQEIRNATEKMITAYKGVVEQQKHESIDSLGEASEELKGQVLAEVEDFKRRLEEETMRSQRLVEGKIQHKYKQLEEELERHKKARLKELDDMIFQVLSDTTKDALGQALSFEEHRELIFAALERARINGGLDGAANRNP